MNLRTSAASIVLLLSILTTSRAHAQDLAGYQQLLLPVFSTAPVSGANGSTFGTSLLGYTETDTSYYAGVPAGSTSPGFITQPALNPGFTPLNYGAPGPGGRFLYVEKARVDDLALQYFLTSQPGPNAVAHVTALPIVRTPLTGTSRLLGIPDHPLIDYPNGQPAGVMLGFAQRNTLRVYDFDGDGSGQVSVERFVSGLFGRQGSLGKVVVNLNQRYGDDPTYPYFGQLDLDYCLPFSLHTPCSGFDMRVEIVPLTPGLRYWGFVSSTDNTTAEVTLFTPQPPR